MITGKNIGVNISNAGAISINVPTIKRITLIINRITILLSDTPSNAELIACGRPVKDNTNDNTDDAPIISMTIAVITAVSLKIPGISLNLILL